MRAHVRERAASEGLGLVGPNPERSELYKKQNPLASPTQPVQQ